MKPTIVILKEIKETLLREIVRLKEIILFRGPLEGPGPIHPPIREIKEFGYIPMYRGIEEVALKTCII